MEEERAPLINDLTKYAHGYQSFPSMTTKSSDKESIRTINDDQSLCNFPFEDEHILSRLYSVDCVTIASRLKSNLERGLSSAEALHRLEQFGKNELERFTQRSLVSLLAGQLGDFMVIMLILAGIASLSLQDWIEATVLFGVVIVNVLIGFLQEWKAERALENLCQLSIPMCILLRDGQRKETKAIEVVPGDICILEEGNLIPADLRLIEASNLQINESILTGESYSVKKTSKILSCKKRKNKKQLESGSSGDDIGWEQTTNESHSPNEILPIGDRRNMAFMSTHVMKGRGVGIVVSTGKRTEVGRISHVLSSLSSNNSQQQTLLQRKLKKLGIVLVILAVTLCALIVGVGFTREYFEGRIDVQTSESWIKVGVSLAVSVIPEGLVAVVSLTMALGVQRMTKRNAIVKKLSAVETLGSITVICTDKTGTLTLGRMTATKVWTQGNTYHATGIGLRVEGCHFIHMDTEEDSKIEPKSFVSLGEKQTPVSSITNRISNVSLNLCTNRASLVINEENIPSALLRCLLIGSLCNSAVVKPHPACPKQWIHNIFTGSWTSYSKKKSSPYTKKTEQFEALGDPTEVALEIAARKIHRGRSYWIEKRQWKLIREVPFDSERCRMSVLYEVPIENFSEIIGDIGAYSDSSFDKNENVDLIVESIGNCSQRKIVLTKGAPGAVLSLCNRYEGFEEKNACQANEQKRILLPITEEVKNRIQSQATLMAKEGLRVLAFAWKVFNHEEIGRDHSEGDIMVSGHSRNRFVGKCEESKELISQETTTIGESNNNDFEQRNQEISIESNLIFVGLVGLLDPPREDVREAIMVCKGAGISVCLITGDHKETAIGIAKQLGIIKDSFRPQEVMRGPELESLSLDQIVEREIFPSVFARINPLNKLKIIQAFKRRGEVVAMIGDGVNDAAAIKSADVGISMGRSATELTKQSADIILADDNFSSIVPALGQPL